MTDRLLVRRDAAEAKFPIGTPVRFHPVAGQPGFLDSAIRSAPWALGHGAIVILIEGRAGSVSVDHLTLLPLAEGVQS